MPKFGGQKRTTGLKRMTAADLKKSQKKKSDIKKVQTIAKVFAPYNRRRVTKTLTRSK